MSKKYWKISSIILISISICLVIITACITSNNHGNLQWILYGACFLLISALFCLKKESEISESSIEAEQNEIEAREKTLKDSEKRLQKRENEFTQKLIKYYEWLEFPVEKESEEREAEEIELFKDQKVLEFLERRTEALFEKIKSNHYYEAGIIQDHLIFQDLKDLIESVAKIYKPDSENPLLETSIEKLLRSINRISLQLLILLEQLPLDLKGYNIKSMYENIRAGVRAYELYKSAKPYIPLIRPVYYLGRFVLGTNPVAIGAGWAFGEIFTRGTQKLSNHLVNQYALNLLHDMVFIIGNEAAEIFGGDYRHREICWIYGSELTDLICRFPLSQEMLLNALNEISNLRLRSEYDRIFLYRCLASHKSASPERFEACTCLSPADRQSIASRLEAFIKNYMSANPKDLLKWKEDTENRLGVKIQLDMVNFIFEDEKKKEHKIKNKRAEAIRSLAGFLLDLKQKQTEDLTAILEGTTLLKNTETNQREEILRDIQDIPPMIFDYPDLEPSDKLLDDYLKDLIRLSVRIFPHDGAGDMAIDGAAHYFRKKPDSLQKEADQMYVDFLAENILPESPEKRIKPHIAREILAYMNPEEYPLFLYTDISVEDEFSNKLRLPLKKDLWLIGTNQQNLILSGICSSKKNETDESSIIMWKGGKTGDNPISVERIKKKFNDDRRLKGGLWLWEPAKELKNPPVLILSGQTMNRYETYFHVLMSRFC